ncbi:MAG: SRPBCC family protein [Roseiarcus sp.]|jgi:hypothetical protein
MASIRKELHTRAPAEAVWAAAADVGALHVRLAPGFVLDTKLEGDARIVTFANGTSVREPIVSIDPENKRLVWTLEGGRARHYNASFQVFAEPLGARVVWICDFLPDEIAPFIAGAMEAGLAAMQPTLDRLEAPS